MATNAPSPPDKASGHSGKSAKVAAASVLTQRPMTKPGKLSTRDARRVVEAYLSEKRA